MLRSLLLQCALQRVRYKDQRREGGEGKRSEAEGRGGRGGGEGGDMF